MYNFFCCCFGEASPVLPISPSLSQPLASECSFYEDFSEYSVSFQDKSSSLQNHDKQALTIENQDTTDTIEPKNSSCTPCSLQNQERFLSKNDLKPTQHTEQQIKSEVLVATTSQFYSFEQLKCFQTLLLDNIDAPITILLKLRIENYIINPLRLGQYVNASDNFCEIFDCKPEQFDELCKVSEMEARILR